MYTFHPDGIRKNEFVEPAGGFGKKAALLISAP